MVLVSEVLLAVVGTVKSLAAKGISGSLSCGLSSIASSMSTFCGWVMNDECGYSCSSPAKLVLVVMALTNAFIEAANQMMMIGCRSLSLHFDGGVSDRRRRGRLMIVR
jgi:hypothetical protein